jgi:hypothetical protein
VVEIRRDLDLREESLGAEHGAEVGSQDLERDAPVVPQIAREIHGRHTARADLTLYLVVIGQRRAELIERIQLSGGRRVLSVETARNIRVQGDSRKVFLRWRQDRGPTTNGIDDRGLTEEREPLRTVVRTWKLNASSFVLGLPHDEEAFAPFQITAAS